MHSLEGNGLLSFLQQKFVSGHNSCGSSISERVEKGEREGEHKKRDKSERARDFKSQRETHLAATDRERG